VTRPPQPGGEPAPVSVAEPSGPGRTDGPERTDRPERTPGKSLARARSPWRTACYGVAVIGLVVGIGWALLGSKLLVVRSVVITGNHLVPASQIRAAAGITPKVPMIRVDTQAAAHRVESINQIQSATVGKSWPDRIVITVHERTPVLAVALASGPSAPATGYDLIDPAGVVVQSVKVRPASLPVYQTSAAASSLRGSPGVAAAATVLHEVPASVARAVVAVSATNPQDVQLGLSTGVTIVWGDTSRARQKATELAILMRTHARYYDVSASGTAVTK
jgi:cell division protein FtsQ